MAEPKNKMLGTMEPLPQKKKKKKTHAFSEKHMIFVSEQESIPNLYYGFQ